MIKAIDSFFKRAFDFSGRSTRSDYWWVMLAFYILYFALIIVMSIIAVITDSTNDGTFIIPIAIIFGILALGLCVPMFSLTIRRFHDAGFSGWLYGAYVIASLVLSAIATLASTGEDIGLLVILIFLLFAAYGYGIFIFVVTLLPSKPDNKWGPGKNSRYNNTYVEYGNDTYKYNDTSNYRNINIIHEETKENNNEVNINNFCPYCGNKLNIGYKFCNKCGKQL